ncbi:YhdH/YhfP family quinone oxidoreductase [Adhaeretor mobilis]|uniref:Acrylyl-CoA reductase AcuI n=1 Tax=Adhaeretor mobilis TaxID=1930276 RepID=A0A517MPK0_9BACT|nr:YhdH/YhfP family quinone oxidoreductase [Adhaeretor mobilis]QDS96794.1 Acrylyl-CoA reductase AcuI [Adhaeretor mobilis]
MIPTEPFSCLMVRREDDEVRCKIESITVDDLPPGEVLIRVEYSSLNYKDALATRATRGIVEKLPHVPGIDCAGEVAASDAADFSPGDRVLVTGYGLGASHWGGFAQYVRVPGEWVVPLSPGLSTREAMTYGTAGFTAAQCVMAIINQGVKPDDSEIVVTGASGGVGSLAVALLAKLGYNVAAVTGKQELADELLGLGASRILGRDDVNDDSKGPLLPAKWAGAVDTVGGNTLATLLRSTKHRGCVAACGLVGGDQLPLTVYPFILRGVTLAGIDSAKCPREPRLDIWQKLSTEWKLDVLDSLAREITLEDLQKEVEAMLDGNSRGRVILRMGEG